MYPIKLELGLYFSEVDKEDFGALMIGQKMNVIFTVQHVRDTLMCGAG